MVIREWRIVRFGLGRRMVIGEWRIVGFKPIICDTTYIVLCRNIMALVISSITIFVIAILDIAI